MLKNSIIRISLVIFALIITFNVGATAQKTDCSKTTDDQIVSKIYEKIKVKYAAQISHINVRSKDGVVTLEGWVTNKKVLKEIEKLAKKTDCVKKVMNELTIGKGGGCGPGTKECGDICINEKDICNICLKGDCE